MPSEKDQARRHSQTHRNSGWNKGDASKALEATTKMMEQWKRNLTGIDDHVKKVAVEKASTAHAQATMARRCAAAHKFLEDTVLMLNLLIWVRS